MIPQTFLGMKIVLSPDRPRYTLPEELVPGVPWPAGFREQINSWSLSYLGTVNLLPEGQVLVVGSTITMRPDDYRRCKAEFQKSMFSGI